MAAAAQGLSGTHETLECESRVAHVYRPSSYPKDSVPVVMVLHGSEQEAKDMFEVGLDRQADLHGFLVVYPEMSEPFGEEWGYAVDIPYFTKLAARLQELDFGADVARLFVCGHSAGGAMVSLLQNELTIFAAAGIVESSVDAIDQWDMSKRGTRTMVIWNHGDPELQPYAENEGDEPEDYYQLTVKTLRRGTDFEPSAKQSLALSDQVIQAELLTFQETPERPEVQILSFRTEPGKHDWADKSWTGTVDASEQLVSFFGLGEPGCVAYSE